MSYRLATTETEAPGVRVSLTIRCFCAARPPAPTRTLHRSPLRPWCPPEDHLGGHHHAKT